MIIAVEAEPPPPRLQFCCFLWWGGRRKVGLLVKVRIAKSERSLCWGIYVHKLVLSDPDDCRKKGVNF